MKSEEGQPPAATQEDHQAPHRRREGAVRGGCQARLHLLRRDVDAAVAPSPGDQRDAVQRLRRALQEDWVVGARLGAQGRLNVVTVRFAKKKRPIGEPERRDRPTSSGVFSALASIIGSLPKRNRLRRSEAPSGTSRVERAHMPAALAIRQ